MQRKSWGPASGSDAAGADGPLAECAGQAGATLCGDAAPWRSLSAPVYGAGPLAHGMSPGFPWAVAGVGTGPASLPPNLLALASAASRC